MVILLTGGSGIVDRDSMTELRIIIHDPRIPNHEPRANNA